MRFLATIGVILTSPSLLGVAYYYYYKSFNSEVFISWENEVYNYKHTFEIGKIKLCDLQVVPGSIIIEQETFWNSI